MSSTSTPFPPGASVVAYLRDSGGDSQELSISQQRASLQRWADDNKVTISNFYFDEARPGSSVAKRDSFLRMINHFRQPIVTEQGVVLWSYSRFSRDINDASFYKADLRRRGFKVFSINDNVPEGIDGVLFEGMISWKDAKFLEDLSFNVIRGINDMMREHGTLGGTPPRGFKRETVQVGSRRNGTPHITARWVPDPDTWDTCKLAWKMRANGANYREISAATNLYTSKNTYTTFFTNRLYLGEMVYGELVIKDYVEPMIDQETWDKVQAMNDKRKLSGPDNPDHPRRIGSSFLLSGLVFCAKCGAPCNGNVVDYPDSKVYSYYFCSRAPRRHDCPALRVPRNVLEAAVFEKLTEVMLDPQMVYQRQAALLDQLSAAATITNQEKNVLNRNLAVIQAKIKNLTDALEASGKESVSVMDRITELEKQAKDIKSQLMEIINQELSGTQFVSADQARKNAQRLLKMLDSKDPEKLRLVFHSQIKKIAVEKDGKFIRGIIYFYGPPDEVPGGGELGVDKEGFMRMSVSHRWETDHTHKIYELPFTWPT